MLAGTFTIPVMNGILNYLLVHLDQRENPHTTIQHFLALLPTVKKDKLAVLHPAAAVLQLLNVHCHSAHLAHAGREQSSKLCSIWVLL